MSENKRECSEKVSPLTNFLLRLTGEWPLSGPPELSIGQYKSLFSSYPAFVDYFSIIDYDDEKSVYLLDDEINVAKIWKVNTRYMCARSEEALARFNMVLTQALNALPTVDDKNPYIVQIFTSSQNSNSIVRDLEREIAEKGLSEDPFSQAILAVNQRHVDLLGHEKGVFPDTRLSGSRGWRLTEQNVYLLIYNKMPAKFWKNNKREPHAQIEHDLSAFLTTLKTAQISLSPLLPHELVNWLAPYFGATDYVSQTEMDKQREMASFDLGQKVIPHQPIYHRSHDDKERGIWRFADVWLRYLTIGGVENPPRDGAMTLGEQQTGGSSPSIDAALFERLPAGSMMSWTIIPQSDYQMKTEVNKILVMAQDGASREARYTTEQAEEVQEEMLRNKHRVCYVQMGVFLKQNSLQDLLDATESTIAEIKATGCIEVINPKFDLISQDSFIRALPTVYSFAHDRNAALRARKCYTAHLASLLPFYGNKSGGNHPCYVMYSRTGEPFYANPFHPQERERVAHEVFFGPSGSGKSATVIYMTAMSMAVNNPRMFVFDYGNSFGLLADYAQSLGKKVKRVVLNAGSADVLAPFFETDKALAEAEIAKRISEATFQPSLKKEEDDDEKRSYLAEMEYILRIMITGGDSTQQMTQSHIARIQEALVRGLQLSKERGEKHARPVHMADAMRMMAEEEAMRDGGLKEIALNLRNMADAITLWTTGLRGMLFNQISQGFDPDYDLTVIEIGSLGKTGTEDMLAVAGLSAIYTITALAEKLQMSGRAIEVKIDEAHLWAKVPMLMSGLVVASKVFRKLQTWLCMITQDVSDFSGDASKILTNAEFWWLMRMSEKEIGQIKHIMNLNEEEQHLIRYPAKESGRFVEGVAICKKYPSTLIRYVPPSLMLALAQTDGHEKQARMKLMKEQNITELEAAKQIAASIDESRCAFQSQT